jgi:hypothetical protein
MLQVSLEFAPGTTDDCKRLVEKLFQPGEILGAYRQARGLFKTSDLVLAVSEKDPSGFRVEPRMVYLETLRRALGLHAPKMMNALVIAQRTAHAVVKLPFESEAMWLIVSRGKELPVMCVIYSLAFEQAATAVN